MTFAANLAELARRVVGLSADNLVALDEAGKLPAVPGDQLTGLVFTEDSGWLPEISIVAGGTFSISHGLSAAPKFVLPFLKNKIAGSNYVANDMVPINPSFFWDGASNGIGLAFRSTTIVGAIATGGNVIPILDLATGNKFSLTAANWRLVLRAFA